MVISSSWGLMMSSYFLVLILTGPNNHIHVLMSEMTFSLCGLYVDSVVSFVVLTFWVHLCELGLLSLCKECALVVI